MLRILLVDDEPLIRLSVGDALRSAGHDVRLASDGAEAITIIDEELFDLVISDVRLPKADGLEVFAKAREASPNSDVVLITAYGSVTDAVSALKDGATDYMTKPFETEHLLHVVERIHEKRNLERDLAEARTALANEGSNRLIIGKSPAMLNLFDRLDTFATSEAPVLITGESGTGKELVARTLHERSPRKAEAFVAVNCAAFPETLLEAELFGHERGAFTGAVRKREGRFKAADGGTLFLDEIAEIPLPAQAKLLRVLQEGSIEPLGTNASVKVDVRIVSATHRDLKKRIEDGRFREDLYYRLKVLDLFIPPLRERRVDLPVLTEHFINRFAPKGTTPTLSPRAWAAINEYAFPGNVRELEHAIHHAVVLARGGEIDVSHLPSEISGGAHTPKARTNGANGDLKPLSHAVKAFEREYLVRALRLAKGKRTRAAEMLGISRKNLWEKLRAQGIQESEWTTSH